MGVTVFVPIVIGITDLDALKLGIIVWLCYIGLFGLIFGSVSLFYFGKIRYLLKNYQKFASDEVVLDRVSTSYVYRGAIYYTVTVNCDGASKNVDTNPYFSSHFASKFNCEDFNNKKVVGLYDEEKNKFYIVKKVD